MMHAREDDFTHAFRKAEFRAPEPAQGAMARARRSVADWIRSARRAREARRSAAMLAHMDDHILRDIGVTRDQMRRLANGADAED